MALGCGQTTLELAFDILSGLISLVDLTTDVIILLSWYFQGRMTFFWVSASILFMAQCSYLALFYSCHGNTRLSALRQCVSFVCTVPFAPVLSFVFHFVSYRDSKLRVLIDTYMCCFNFDWHDEFSAGPPESSRQWLKRLCFKHAGFLLEAAVEAFPQSSV